MRFEEFTAARLPALLRCATLLTRDREEAHDIVQEVLTRALIKWDRIARIEEPYAYVRRMVTNEFLSLKPRFEFMVQARDPDSKCIPKPPPSAEHTTVRGRDARIWASPLSPSQHAVDAGPIVQWRGPSGVWLDVSPDARPGTPARPTVWAT